MKREAKTKTILLSGALALFAAAASAEYVFGDGNLTLSEGLSSMF